MPEADLSSMFPCFYVVFLEQKLDFFTADFIFCRDQEFDHG